MLEKKLTKDYYDHEAEFYYLDHPEKSIFTFYELLVMSKIIKELSMTVAQNNVVVDIGCGTGVYTKALKDLGVSDVIGIDISKNMLRYAVKKGIKSVILGDGTMLPLRDESVDLACSFAVLEHIPKTALFLSEVSRVLKPDKNFLIMTPNPKSFALISRRSMKQHKEQYERFIYPEHFLALLMRRFKVIDYLTVYILPGSPFSEIIRVLEKIIGWKRARRLLYYISVNESKIIKDRGYLQLALCRKP